MVAAIRIVVAAAMLALAACGTSTSTSIREPVTSLAISYQGDEGHEPRAATLVCEEDDSRGTGFLADRAAAACGVALDPAKRTLLIDPIPQDRVCTEIYGGPQRSTVTGTVEGDPVERTFSRVNGCEIADWESLAVLIAP